MKIKLNNKEVEVNDSGVIGGIHARMKLLPEQYTYQLYRDSNDREKPDELISDTTPLREGDDIYSVPPATM